MVFYHFTQSLVFYICCSVFPWKHVLACLMLYEVVSSLRMKMFLLTLCIEKCFVKVGCLNSLSIYVVVFFVNGSFLFSKSIRFIVSIVMSSTWFSYPFYAKQTVSFDAWNMFYNPIFSEIILRSFYLIVFFVLFTLPLTACWF